MTMKMTKAMLQADGVTEAQAAKFAAVYEKYGDVKKFDTQLVAGDGGDGSVYKRSETEENKMLRHDLMKEVLKPIVEGVKFEDGKMVKTSVTSASGFDPYDLMVPSRHLVPWLSPIRESLPRTKRAGPGNTAHWKAITANSSSYSRGGAGASPWVNEGQRASQITLATIPVSQNYVTIGKDGTVTFEAVSSSEGFEDALATAHFFTLETLMVSEEDSLIGGNKTLKLATANTPTGTTTGSGSFSGTFYAKVIGLTYEGYRNFVLDNGLSTTTGLPLVTTGLTQQRVIITGDNKTMTVNTGCGIPSAASSAVSPSSSVSATFSVTAKTGEIAWLWFLGTANTNGSLYLQACTTVPSYTITAAPGTSTQLLSALNTTVDYSVNDGTTGGGVNQVTAYDGIITQCLNNTSLTPQNAYVLNNAGSILTTSGRGNVVEIDTMLLNMWNLYKVTVDVIYVNAQEMVNITNRVLNTTSAPLLRYERDGDMGEYALTGNGSISFYFNPYIPGGRKIPIMIHPTLPPGTILAMAKTLPPYFKTNSTPVVAEVLERRPYYALEYAQTTREYQFGTYAENAGPAIYAPFCFGLITAVGNG
jgi:hypothetical protein